MQNSYKSQLMALSKTIRDDIFNEIYSFKTTIFLCGSTTKSRTSVRDQIAKQLSTAWYAYKYDIYYPEELFDELLLGPGHIDLLKLESILAESVDVIVLIPESWGSVAELGVFANNQKIRKKLLCIQDIKHRKTKSFINYGPIRSIKESKEGKVLYVDYAKIPTEIDRIRAAISELHKSASRVSNVANIIQAENFILPCIYLIEPVDRNTLTDLVKFAAETDEKNATAATSAALSLLIKKKIIDQTSEG